MLRWKERETYIRVVAYVNFVYRCMATCSGTTVSFIALRFVNSHLSQCRTVCMSLAELAGWGERTHRLTGACKLYLKSPAKATGEVPRAEVSLYCIIIIRQYATIKYTLSKPAQSSHMQVDIVIVRVTMSVVLWHNSAFWGHCQRSTTAFVNPVMQ